VIVLIYAIAAYSITLSALALYGVVLQHRARVYSANQGSSVGTVPGGFNLGAALLSPFWMWAHGMRLPGAILFGIGAAMIPFLGREMWIPAMLLASTALAAGAALGLVGNRIAFGHRGSEPLRDFSASQLPWAAIGVALYTIVFPWGWYFLIYVDA
jgi:hypothetical protein